MTFTEPTVFNPRMMVLFGPSKVGKTTEAVNFQHWHSSEIPGLTSKILDMEGGTDMYRSVKEKITSLKDLMGEIKKLKQEKVNFLFVDTLDKIVEWLEELVCKENDVQAIGDLAFGKGYGLVREKTMKIITHLKACCDTLILIGHRKKTIIGNESVEVNVTSLDLPGKLKNVICADADAIGYMYRNEGELMISFKPSDELEAGSRFEHLQDVFKFDWQKIFKFDNYENAA